MKKKNTDNCTEDTDVLDTKDFKAPAAIIFL